MTDRTKQCVKKRNLFYVISTLTWVLTACTYIVCAVKKGLTASTADDGLGTYLLSISMTLLIAIILTIVIKDKVRNTIWMACVILGSILFNETGMYITFALWAFDEYVLHALYKSYKHKVTINKEIDLRG